MYLHWDFSDMFLIISLGLWVWGVKCHFITSYQGYINQCDLLLLMLTFITRLSKCSLGFSTINLLQFFFFSFHTVLFRRNSLVQPTLQERDLCFNSLGTGYLHKIFGILLQGRFVSPPPFIYLLNHLLISVWTHGLYTYTLCYNPILLYFFYCSNHPIFSQWEFFLLDLVALTFTVGLCLLISSIFLPCGTTRYTRLTSYIFCPSFIISIFPKIPESFDWKCGYLAETIFLIKFQVTREKVFK